MSRDYKKEEVDATRRVSFLDELQTLQGDERLTRPSSSAKY